MILEALCDYYETLDAHFGWNEIPVSAILEIDNEGALTQVICCLDEHNHHQMHLLPARAKRSSGIKPNFLSDNAKYLLGYDSTESNTKAIACFQACAQLHQKLLTGLESSAARSLLKFFSSWKPEKASSHPALQNLPEAVFSSNCIFRINGLFVHTDPDVMACWDVHYQNDADGPKTVCLTDGTLSIAEHLHPNIKGVFGANTSGASLISFNKESFCSYGKEQNLNAPLSKKAAFAYTTALNTLLADKEHVFRLGDTTVVFWSKGGKSAYQDLFNLCMRSTDSIDTQEALGKALEKITRGENVLFEGETINPDMEFYILGLSPNAARLSVRFFLTNTFGHFLENIREHYLRLDIVRPTFDKQRYPPLWKLLDETVNRKSSDKSPQPKLVGDVLRAIVTGTPYPTGLLTGVQLRIVADRDEIDAKSGKRYERRMTRNRAAIIKAYYLKNTNPDVPKEVLTVALNENSTDTPYNLGRLFSVLEAIQSAAVPEVSVTIKDKFFSSASSTPATIFPLLINLAQNHLHQIDSKGMVVIYDKLLTEIMGKLGGQFPRHLNLAQRGSFQLGYYHQTQVRFTKKEI